METTYDDVDPEFEPGDEVMIYSDSNPYWNGFVATVEVYESVFEKYLVELNDRPGVKVAVTGDELVALDDGDVPDDLDDYPEFGMPDDPFVEHPPHYTSHPSGVECIEITKHMDFLTGNAMKYLWRHADKGDPVQDLEKARFYINQKIDMLKGETVER